MNVLIIFFLISLMFLNNAHHFVLLLKQVNLVIKLIDWVEYASRKIFNPHNHHKKCYNIGHKNWEEKGHKKGILELVYNFLNIHIEALRIKHQT